MWHSDTGPLLPSQSRIRSVDLSCGGELGHVHPEQRTVHGRDRMGVAPTGGADTVTANFGTDTGYVEVYVQEYNAANPQLDVTASAAALDSATPITSGAATTNYPNELVFGYAMANNTVSAPGTGLTQRQGVGGDISEDKSVSTTGSYAATATGCCTDAYYSQALMATFYGTGPNIPVPSQVTGSLSGWRGPVCECDVDGSIQRGHSEFLHHQAVHRRDCPDAHDGLCAGNEHHGHRPHGRDCLHVHGDGLERSW